MNRYSRLSPASFPGRARSRSRDSSAARPSRSRFRVTPKPDYELKSYEPVSITVPPFEIEQAESRSRSRRSPRATRSSCRTSRTRWRKATASCWRSKLPERREDGQPVHRRPHVPHRHGPHARGLREASHRHERGRNEVVLLRPARHERRRQGRHRRLHRHRQGDAEKGRPRHR